MSTSDNLVAISDGPGVRVAVTPETADWRFLSFSIVKLEAGDTHHSALADQETAIVPLSGAGTVSVDGAAFDMSRASVFTEVPAVLYAPPRTEIGVTSSEGFEFAIGSAPAEGLLPTRLVTADEIRSEVRGGGAAHRQVNHILSHPLPAERLILYEVYVPRGTWSGWAPHRHDGVDGSPYLEEVYWFRFDPGDGFGLHRNWAPEANFDETLVLHDGDVALCPKGYHSSVACPSSNMYFLNYLAGELVGDERVTPPCFHEAYTWIQEDWDAGAWTQPVIPR